ncbi:hypothetical protein PQJ75_24410 [Rhodoplanes sp. TEM]|uniref:Uncharacterized protein n=1 Tax=Rhodoplanes tepidamans TaxID=200616 RepID=A0ABT5JD16_RHOTP|nr:MULTISPECIES: hypothetical protein [Rhodoplanes]MDC7787590.1 hypothetical protein [Rhodoplanes tepidamans]MDC7986885.1 hypothetical protein [Rhodoplanes sp. TEM]MDQ0358018.1 hypothetical protein [Rhodoplanes tepidamans]
MEQSVATIVMDAMPVLLLALAIVLLPATIEPPGSTQPVREPARPRRR